MGARAIVLKPLLRTRLADPAALRPGTDACSGSSVLSSCPCWFFSRLPSIQLLPQPCLSHSLTLPVRTPCPFPQSCLFIQLSGLVCAVGVLARVVQRGGKRCASMPAPKLERCREGASRKPAWLDSTFRVTPSATALEQEGVAYLQSGPCALGPEAGANSRAPGNQANIPCIIIDLRDIMATAGLGHCELRAPLGLLPYLTLMSSRVFVPSPLSLWGVPCSCWVEFPRGIYGPCASTRFSPLAAGVSKCAALFRGIAVSVAIPVWSSPRADRLSL